VSSASGGPPKLAPFGLTLRRDGTFWHEGVQVTHPRLREQFLRSVEWSEAEGAFIVRLRHFRGWLDVEDTPWFVVAYDAEQGEIELTDGTREPLQPETLRVDPDQVLRCAVKGGRWDARFTHRGQAHLLDAVESDGEELRLRVGSRRVPLPESLRV
jgi:hypothetical protein